VALDRLSGWGELAFVLAVVAAGVSLAAAALSVAPKWVKFNPYSRDSMRGAVQEIYSRRRNLLKVAAWAFAAAIVLAGISPLLSTDSSIRKSEQSALTYEMSPTGKLNSQYVVRDVGDSKSFSVSLVAEPPLTDMTLPRSCSATDKQGAGTAKLELASVQGIKSKLFMVGRLDCKTGRLGADRVRAVPDAPKAETQRQSALTYEFAATGKLSGQYMVRDFGDSKSFSVSLVAEPPLTGMMLPRSCAATDKQGAGAAKLQLASVKGINSKVFLVGRLDCKAGRVGADRVWLVFEPQRGDPLPDPR
jgi:hypothetical protein